MLQSKVVRTVLLAVLALVIAVPLSASAITQSADQSSPKATKTTTAKKKKTRVRTVRGPRGATGATGATGAAGATGPAGATGATGAVGATGATGETGSQGPKGVQGDKGLKGDTGVKGDTGNTGASAYEVWKAAGNTGTEAEFIASLQGAQGATGATGPAGPAGPLMTTLTSGATKTGAWGVKVAPNVAFFDDTLDFGMQVRGPLTVQIIKVVNDTANPLFTANGTAGTFNAPTTQCNGNLDSPKASAPGFLCIYVGQTDNVREMAAFPIGGSNGLSGFDMQAMSRIVANSAFVYGSYAVRGVNY
jgi:hypothetical protein